MRLKVLVTGKNRRIAKDVCEHLETDKGYVTVKCPPKKTALFDTVISEMPNIFIMCLGDETVETVNSYNVLKEAVRQRKVPVIVITNDEDREMFMEHSELSKVFFLSRPLSIYALYEKLSVIEKQIDLDMEKNEWEYSEYINPNADRDFVRKRILVVDDDTEQLINIKELLKEFYDVTVVKSGKAAFKFLEKQMPDIILLDFVMPEMDGPAVLNKLKTDSRYSRLPVIFLTGMTERDTVIRTLTELKPQGYIVKPARKSDLVAKIIDVIG